MTHEIYCNNCGNNNVKINQTFLAKDENGKFPTEFIETACDVCETYELHRYLIVAEDGTKYFEVSYSEV